MAYHKRGYRNYNDRRVIKGRGIFSSLKKLAKKAFKLNDSVSRRFINPALRFPLNFIPGTPGKVAKTLINTGLASNEATTKKLSELAGNGLLPPGVSTQSGFGLQPPGVGTGLLSMKNRKLLNKMLGGPTKSIKYGKGVNNI